MATETARDLPRIVLQDRWDAVMDPDRNGGNATEDYVDLTVALRGVVDIVAGSDEDTADVLDDITLFSIGEVIVGRILELGIAR